MKKILNIILLIGILLLITSCGQKEINITTGKIINSSEIRTELYQNIKYSSPILSANNYLEVNNDAIQSLIDSYRNELFHLNVVVSDVTGQSGWDQRFNCTDFTDLFLGYSGAKVMNQLRTSWSLGQKPAIFAVWYMPDSEIGKINQVGHSIVLIITNKGFVFVDPQLENPVHLTATELNSIYHIRS